MSKRVVNQKKDPSVPENRRLRLVDPFAMALSCVVLAATVALAILSSQTGFYEHWYGDVLTMLDWIVGILALVNLFATASVGIRVTNGKADLGRRSDGERHAFDTSLLRCITVADQAGNALPLNRRFWRNACLKFHLTDGTTLCSRPAAILTERQLSAAVRFFGLSDRS